MAAFATSYIKTEATQETRNADAASMTGTNFSSWFNNGEGSFVFNALNLGASSTIVVPLLISDGLATRNGIYYQSTATSGSSRVYAGSILEASVNTGAFSNSSFSQYAFNYAFNDIRAYKDGAQTGVDTTAVVSYSLNKIEFSSPQHLKKFAYYPQALTAANLQALTA